MNAPDNMQVALALLAAQDELRKHPGLHDWPAVIRKHAPEGQGERFVEALLGTLEIPLDKALRIWRGEEALPQSDFLDALDGRVSAFLDSRDADERRRWTRELNRAIGNKPAQPYKPEFMPQADMLDRCVYVEERNEVVMLPPAWAADNGMRLMCVPPAHFKQMQAGNLGEHPTRRLRDGSPAMVSVAKLWLDGHEKDCVREAMYAIGRPRYIHTPNGELAVNLWSPLKREKSETDISLFLNHVDYLFGVWNASIAALLGDDGPKEDDPDQVEKLKTRERFLDWLAHCEQKPAELPHNGWLMWTEQFGIGRNWLGSVLTRVWQGEVAPSLDLVSILAGGFNNALSCKRFAFVDEIHIGSNNSLHTLAARLRQIMTEEIRVINPKYGKMTMEYNTTRWLIFSNHDDALPIPQEDRRFEVVNNPGQLLPAEHYATLYKALDEKVNPGFIAGVALFLASRDISKFNAGARPELTPAKQHVINASMPSIERDVHDTIARWKAAGILMFCSSDLIRDVGATPQQAASFHHIMKRAKTVKIGRHKIGGKLEWLWAMDKETANRLLGDGGLMEECRKRIMLERGDGGLFHHQDSRNEGGSF